MTSVTWETATDWDGGSDDGTIHESVANTDHTDASNVKRSYQISNPSPSFGTKASYYPLHEDSGTNLNDFSGNANDGELQSGTLNVTGVVGTTALDLDSADNDHAAIYPGFASSFSGMSMFIWMKTTDGSESFLAGHDRNEYYRLAINDGQASAGTGELTLSFSDSSSNVNDSTTGVRVDDGVWHHVGFVYDSGNFDIYIDGVSEHSGSQGSKIGTGTTRYGFIGDDSEATSFNGSQNNTFCTATVSEYRIYTKALTSSEVQTLYDVVDKPGIHHSSTKTA